MNMLGVTRILFFLLLAIVGLSCADPQRPELEISPETDILETGQPPVQLTVHRRYPGGATRDVTNLVSYSSTNMLVATVSPQGRLTAGSETGTTTIRVTDLETDAFKAFTVNVVEPAAQRLVSIDVVPSALVMPPGSTRQFVAQGRYADGSVRDVTRQVLWASERPEVAVVGVTAFDYGIVRSIANGQTRITATDAVTQIRGAADLFVQGVATQLEAIVVTPNPAGPIAVAGTQQFVATGFFANGTTQDVTNAVQWESSVPGVATVATGGLATGVAAGDTTISAVSMESGVRGSAALKVQ